MLLKAGLIVIHLNSIILIRNRREYIFRILFSLAIHRLELEYYSERPFAEWDDKHPDI